MVFFTSFVNGQTNVYHPFPESEAIWNFNFWPYCFIGPTGNQDYSITIIGDTTINSMTYQKLFTPFVQSSTTGLCANISTGYKGAIRQDTTLKKVFYFSPNASTEKLLYDFNMQVGDSVLGCLNSIDIPTIDTVIQIDSILVGNNYRKRWKINDCYNIYLIEGIGSTYGLITFLPGCLTDQASCTLQCFHQESETIYPDTSINCQLISNLSNTDKNFEQIKVFPNPSNGSINIDIGNIGMSTIKLTDLLGNIVIQRVILSNTIVVLDNLETGLYVLSVISKDNILTNRVVISSP